MSADAAGRLDPARARPFGHAAFAAAVAGACSRSPDFLPLVVIVAISI
jgi:hypothetical protein